MNNLKRLKSVTAILAVLAFVLVTGCTDNKSVEASQMQDKLLKGNGQTNNEDQPENKVQIETFTSKEGGFSLKQPEKWNGHVGVIDRKGDPVTGTEWETSFYLLVNGKPDVDAGAIITITKMTKAQHDAIAAEEGPSSDDILGENGKYVWTMTTPQTNPYGEKSEEYKNFNTMLVNAEFIKMHFKMNS
ncbi:hypothetical protein NQ117_14895 [Paenibacillus sp. SC116]|uniref:hypothetical protein n=1 Tax=Paenibacillus sp. SC116 TaxID=2968986 RepID=UPI00215B2EF8|nr:hypothetical protein [Paenibacillus sp. SC116]MCR8844967.1 hypothetical protein [Paenibacillus sp. SC116]